MHRFRRIVQAALLAILTLSLLVAASGCLEQTPPLAPTKTAPDAGSQPNFLRFRSSLQGSDALAKTVTVSELITVSSGGTLALEAGVDPGLLAELAQDPPLSSSQLYWKLAAENPLSPTVLIRAIERPTPMYPTHLYTLLADNTQLRTSVLQSLLDHADRLHPSYLTQLLIASSPLPAEIWNQVAGLGLPDSYYAAVAAAQNGAPAPDHTKNLGGGGVSASLRVLAGAVTEDAELTMTMDDEVVLANLEVVFGPHGTQFDPPAILNIEASGLDLFDVDPASINVYYDNPETGQWEVMPSDSVIVHQNEGYVRVIRARLPHFSRYALAVVD